MTPALALRNVRNGSATDIKISRYSRWPIAVQQAIPDGADILLTQFSRAACLLSTANARRVFSVIMRIPAYNLLRVKTAVMPFTTRDPLRVETAPVVVSTLGCTAKRAIAHISAFANIPCIIFARPKIEVIGANAHFIVTLMQYPHASRNISVSQFPCHPTRLARDAVIEDGRITGAPGHGQMPYPACISLDNVLPDACFDRCARLCHKHHHRCVHGHYNTHRGCLSISRGSGGKK